MSLAADTLVVLHVKCPKCYTAKMISSSEMLLDSSTQFLFANICLCQDRRTARAREPSNLSSVEMNGRRYAHQETTQAHLWDNGEELSCLAEPTKGSTSGRLATLKKTRFESDQDAVLNNKTTSKISTCRIPYPGSNCYP